MQAGLVVSLSDQFSVANSSQKILPTIMKSLEDGK